jgi:hypothetical protein
LAPNRRALTRHREAVSRILAGGGGPPLLRAGTPGMQIGFVAPRQWARRIALAVFKKGTWVFSRRAVKNDECYLW